MIALAASLRNKAKSVLSSFKDTETLDLKTLLEKLEARFGEHLGSSSFLYSKIGSKSRERIFLH